MLTYHLLAVLALVWRCAGEHLEEDRPEGVDIGAAVEVGMPHRLFGAHVGWRTHHESGLGIPRTPVEALGDPKVHQQGSPGARIEHDVVGLDVAMDQSRLVRVLERAEQPDGERHRTGHRHRALTLECGRQRLTVNEGHRVVHEALALTDKMNRQDVGMIERGDGARLLPEARQGAFGPDQVGPKHLHGELPLQLPVEHLVHLGEAAGPDAPAHLVRRAKRLREPLGHRAGLRYGDRLGHGGLVVRHRLCSGVRFRARGAREAQRVGRKPLTGLVLRCTCFFTGGGGASTTGSGSGASTTGSGSTVATGCSTTGSGATTGAREA